MFAGFVNQLGEIAEFAPDQTLKAALMPPMAPSEYTEVEIKSLIGM